MPKDASDLYLHPADLFEKDAGNSCLWTCVRTRPRWEKRFSTWLRRNNMPHFLPVTSQRSVSGRKHRVTLGPLFAGYVFLNGEYGKAAFVRSGCVVYLLRPRSVGEALDLDAQIRGVWASLGAGRNPWREDRFEPGETVRILSGPMEGTIGRLVRKANQDRFVVWVEMLGAGVSVEVPARTGFAKVIADDRAVALG